MVLVSVNKINLSLKKIIRFRGFYFLLV